MARMPDLRIAARKMRVLFIGAHCDDIELGCGGLIHKLTNEAGELCEVYTHTLCACSLDPKLNKGVWGNLRDVQYRALGLLGVSNMTWSLAECRRFANGREYVYASLENKLSTIKPDLVFCNEADEHQDHEALFKEIKRFRNLNLFTYSLRKLPGHFIVPLKIENILAKTDALLCYTMYQDRSYFLPNHIAQATAMQSDCKYAESFTVQSMYDWNFGVGFFTGELT